MGIKDLFSHRDRSDDEVGPADRAPQGDEAGASTTPSDDGRGTVGLGDRLGGAAPDTNQAKTEPMPPTPGHADPVGSGPHTDPPAVPELGDMSAGRALSQVASPTVLPDREPPPLPAVHDTSTPDGGTVPAEDRTRVGTSSSTGTAAGPEMPESQTTGAASRAPGQQGITPDGESIDSDTAAGAARMHPGGGPDATAPPQDFPGDSRGVNVPHEQAAEGTSQEQGIVHGIKDPTRD